MAAEVLADLGLNVCFVGVAKGEGRKPGLEQIIFPNDKKPLQLATTHAGLHLIQQIRDEAHRFAIQGHRAKRGKTRTDAIIEAGATRLRPILMTTTATIVGMLPVALRIGRASEVRAPMAIVVIGGLLVSTTLTLVVIPVLFSLFDDWFPGRGRAAAEGTVPPLSPEPE